MYFIFLRWLLVSGSLLLSASAVQAQTRPAGNGLATLLKVSRWQKRVLLLCAPSASDAALLRQRELLATARPDLQARDLLVHEILLDQISATDRKYLTKTLRVSGASFVVLLVGKDGGVKRRETEPVAPASLFKTIDVMPMRRQEMKKQ